MKPLESANPLIIYLDVKSPYAFVALEPTLALEASLGLEFDWRTLTLDIPSYLGSARKKDGKVVESTGRDERLWNAIRYSYRDTRRYAERQGHVLKGTEKIWDSSLINIAIDWVAAKHRSRLGEYLRSVFPTFWRRELDIEDLQTVVNTLSALEIDADDFHRYQEEEGRQRHDQRQASFHNAGIYGVPTYVIEGEVFFGREHLPYLRWRLSGGEGTPPDIAYELLPC